MRKKSSGQAFSREAIFVRNWPDGVAEEPAMQLVVNVLVAAGAAGVVTAVWRALAGRSRTRRSPKSLAFVSFAALTMGAVCWWATKSHGEPQQSVAGAPARLVSTPTHFSSDALGVTLNAPAGWRFQHEGATLTAIQGELGADQAPANLTLESLVLGEPASVEQHLERFKRRLKGFGLKVRDSFRDSIAGSSALAFISEGNRGKISIWMVHRGPRSVLLIQCLTRDGADPRVGCGPVLKQLSLREPTDPKAKQ